MTKYIYILLSLFLVVINISCKKINEKKTTIKGVVWEYCGEEVVKHVKMDLFECKYTSSASMSFEQTLIKTVETNELGMFDFGELKLDKRENKYFYKVTYQMGKDDYLGLSSGAYQNPNLRNFGIMYPKANTDNYDTIMFCGYSKSAKLIFSPRPPYNLSDSVNISILGKYNNIVVNWHYLDLVKSNGEILEGKSYAGLYTIKIYKKRNNIITEYTDVWKINWKESATYTVNFN